MATLMTDVLVETLSQEPILAEIIVFSFSLNLDQEFFTKLIE